MVIRCIPHFSYRRHPTPSTCDGWAVEKGPECCAKCQCGFDCVGQTTATLTLHPRSSPLPQHLRSNTDRAGSMSTRSTRAPPRPRWPSSPTARTDCPQLPWSTTGNATMADSCLYKPLNALRDAYLSRSRSVRKIRAGRVHASKPRCLPADEILDCSGVEGGNEARWRVDDRQDANHHSR